MMNQQAAPTPSTLTVDAWDEGRLAPPTPAPASGGETANGRLQWSHTTIEALSGERSGQAFPIFDLSICGTPLFGACVRACVRANDGHGGGWVDYDW